MHSRRLISRPGPVEPSRLLICALDPKTMFEMIPRVMLLDIAAGEADIALCVVMSEPDPTLIRRKISTARFTLFGAPSYAAIFK